MSTDSESTNSDVVHLHKDNVQHLNKKDNNIANLGYHKRNGSASNSMLADSVIDDVQSNNFYDIDKSKPETFLTEDDLEKVSDSQLFPQKRLFRWFHSRRIPTIPDDQERKIYPMKRTNIISKIFFLWVIPALSVGYKRTLQPNDLWKMDEKMSIETLYSRFVYYMNKYVEKARADYRESHPAANEHEVMTNAKLPKAALVKVLFMTFRVQYILAIIFVCVGNAASALTPLVTKKLIAFVEEKTYLPSLKVNDGIGYAIGSVILMLINGILFNHFLNNSILTGVQVKALLIKAILHKSMKLSGYSRHRFPSGNITSLMSTDVSRLEMALAFQPLLFAFPVVFIICLVLLLVNLGPIALVGFGIFFLIIAANFYAFRFVFKFRLASNKFTDARVTLMREILNSIKMIKYYAWETAYQERVTDVRKKETELVRKMQLIRNVMTALTLYFPYLASCVTFLAMYKVNNGGRSPANIFASLSLFQVLTIQMFFLPMAISTGIDAYIGLGRVQTLLEAEEESYNFIENEEDLELDSDVAIRIKNASFEWANFELEDAKDVANNNGEELFVGDSTSMEMEKGSKLSMAQEKVSFNGFHDLDLEIKKNEFIIITGPIGTGKSSLLSAIAGFMTKTSGSIAVNGDLLLCGYPWVQNATVKDNIIFGSPYDEEKYKEVIRICSLQADLDILPAGDRTEIGERGITLSGGQKARINLARSVYKNMDIYLFDDVLSAVDSRVSKHIVEECMLGYLGAKTRVIATHQLSLIHTASRVVYLGSDGKVDVGTVDELLSRNKGFENLMKYQASEQDTDEEDLLSDVESMKYEEDNNVIASQKSLKQQISGSSNEDGRITAREERAVNGLSFKVYKEYLITGCGKGVLLIIPIFLFFNISTTFCNIFSSVWLSFWTDEKFAGKSTGFYMGLYIFFVFFGLVCIASQFTILCLVGNKAARLLNLKSLARLLHTPMSFIDTTPIGRILNRFTKDTDVLDNEISESLRLFLYQTANLTGVIIMCIIYLPWFAIAVPFIVFMYVFVADHYQASGREIKRMEAVQRSFVYNNFNEVLGGLDTIKAYKSEQRFLMKSDFLINRMNEAGYLVVSVQRWVSITVDILAAIFALIISLLCVTRQFKVNAGSVGVMLTYVLQLPGLMNALLRAQTQTENDMNSAERLVSYATSLPMEAKYRIPETQPDSSWPNEGRITFDNVSLAYRPGLPLVLNNVNLNIKGCEKIGICGRTGAGKSTIMSALYRLVELHEGKITIDDVDISRLGLYELRHKLSIIPQDPVLFKGTLRKNLDPFGERTDNELWDALVRSGAIEASQLQDVKKEHKDQNGIAVDMHKFHLDQEVEEEGSNYSLGERQVLALTRALVRGSKVLILDEATSSVDYETDAKIQSSIVKEFSACTILCIAHRLKTILHYDRILVLEKGSVAEFDTPSNLFNNKKGIFHSMCVDAGIVEEDLEEPQGFR